MRGRSRTPDAQASALVRPAGAVDRGVDAASPSNAVDPWCRLPAMSFRVAVEKALQDVPSFARPVTEAILEIAYLTMAVDDKLQDEEIEAFSIISASLLGRETKLDDGALRTWLDRFSAELRGATLHDRLDAAVKKLGGDPAAREASYRVACLMAMSDLDAHDREFEFDLDLIAALELEQDVADRIADELNDALLDEPS
jgi:hypothetical protein